MSKKRTFFPIYQRILRSVFILWVFLWMMGKFGFNFALDLSLLFKTFLFLFLIILIWETKKRWSQIYPVIRGITREIGNILSIRIKNIQEKIICLSPRILSKKWGIFFALFLSVVFLFSLTVGQIFKKCLIFLISKNVVFLLTILGLIIDIFVFNFVSFLVVLFFTVSSLVTIRLHRFEGKVAFAVGLIFLFLCPFLLAFKTKPIAVEKVAIWTYIFLAIGAGQMFVKDVRDIRK